MKKPLTFYQESFIRDNYLKLSSRLLSERLCMSNTRVLNFLKRNGLKVPKEIFIKWRTDALRKPLTDNEIEFIHSNIEKMSIKQMSKEMHRTSRLISDAAHSLGYSELILKRHLNSTFQKGIVPANKGKKLEEFMSLETIEKFKRNQFKKGHIPHNEKFDGHERIDNGGYVWMRISRGKYVLKHRHVWESVHGKIQEGYVISFIDENKTNCAIENLEMISMADNLRRNYHQFPPEIKKAMALNNKILKHLNHGKQ